MVDFVKLVHAYSRLSDAELAEYYELRHLLEEQQVRALIFVRARRSEQPRDRHAA